VLGEGGEGGLWIVKGFGSRRRSGVIERGYRESKEGQTGDRRQGGRDQSLSSLSTSLFYRSIGKGHTCGSYRNGVNESSESRRDGC
jgi:hypothetical protein